jgi:hypothetical protein
MRPDPSYLLSVCIVDEQRLPRPDGVHLMWVSNGDPPTCSIVDVGVGMSYKAWGVDLMPKANHFRNRLKTCFGVNKPVSVTELAEHGFPSNDELLAQQARYVIQGYVRGLAACVENIAGFAPVSAPYDPQEQGLLYQDALEPKPAHFAYPTLTPEPWGYHFASARTVPGGEGYVFQRPSRPDETSAWGKDALASTGSRLRIVDRNGTVSYVQDGGDGRPGPDGE